MANISSPYFKKLLECFGNLIKSCEDIKEESNFYNFIIKVIIAKHWLEEFYQVLWIFIVKFEFDENSKKYFLNSFSKVLCMCCDGMYLDEEDYNKIVKKFIMAIVEYQIHFGLTEGNIPDYEETPIEGIIGDLMESLRYDELYYEADPYNFPAKLGGYLLQQINNSIYREYTKESWEDTKESWDDERVTLFFKFNVAKKTIELNFSLNRNSDNILLCEEKIAKKIIQSLQIIQP